MLTGVQRFITKATFNESDRIDLYDNFRQYLLDGVDIETAYKKLIESYSRRGRKPNHPIAEILRECLQSLDGSSLADSLSEWIPERERSIIAANEEANKPAEGFKKCIELCTGVSRLRKSIRKTVGVIGFMAACFFGLLTMICVIIVPLILRTIPLYMWTNLQKSIYYFYVFMTDYWYVAFVCVAALTYIFILSLPRWTGDARYHFDKHFPYSLYRVMNGAIFISNIDSMLSSGIPLKDALLKLKHSSGSNWLNERIDGALVGLSAGEANLGYALDVSGYDFPSEDALIKLCSLFDTTNREGSLTNFSKRWLDSTIENIENIGQSIQGFGMLACSFGIISVCAILYPLIAQTLNM